jgi:hypothetical protein
VKGKLVFGAGLALGFVLGSKSGRSAYESLKTKSRELWHNPTVQDKVHEATGAVKDKAPGVAEHLTEAAKKASSAAASKLPGKHGKDDGGASTGTTTTVGDEGGAMPGSPPAGDTGDLRPPGPGA